jgi:DNA-binding NarL/FixJ family response regulator
MKLEKKISVLVVEDHPVARVGIRSALMACERLNVVGVAETGEKAVSMARRFIPDVMVLDIELPDMDGLDVAGLIRDELPGIRIILLTVHENARYIERAAQLGVSGYLLKNTSAESLVESVLAVGAPDATGGRTGKSGINLLEDTERTQVAAAVHLSRRDKKILEMVADGRTNKEIAAELGIAKVTASSYRTKLRTRLGIRTTAELTTFAIARGLVPGRRK